ncbi:hypothetical protein EOD23_02030 [Mesorhizobium sp. USDA-HM6]|nr:hypothetical protein EOD23_02030 [Mesorhizobium sp. USDA-HM6]
MIAAVQTDYGVDVSKAAEKPVKVVIPPGPKKLRLFYAWQSDLASTANRNGIRNALKDVTKSILPRVALTIDEATRDTPGSPNIPAKIMEKIRACDLFVADVTTVVGKAGETRPCANPNVIFELGYAVAHVGWDRIILVINGKISPVSDLPFDFDRHRAMVYAHDEKPTKEQKEALVKDLKGAIDLITEHNPPRPKEIEGQSEEQVRRRRDVTNITWALEQIHQPSVDDLVTDLPYKVSDKAFWYYESFKGVVTNSLFHINDAGVSKLFREMLDGWSIALSAGEHYQMSSNPHYYVWTGNQPSANNARDRVAKGASKLAKARKALLERIRNDYLEVDIDAASKKAFNAYRSELAAD